VSLKSEVDQVWQDRAIVAYRAPQLYDPAVGGGIYDLFEITGPVLITLLGGRQTGAAGAGAAVLLNVNAVDLDGGAIAVDAAIGAVFLSCLNVAGTLVNALGIPMTDALLHSKGFVAGTAPAANGVISSTWTVDTWIGEIFCVYRRLSPTAELLLA